MPQVISSHTKRYNVTCQLTEFGRAYWVQLSLGERRWYQVHCPITSRVSRQSLERRIIVSGGSACGLAGQSSRNYFQKLNI